MPKLIVNGDPSQWPDYQCHKVVRAAYILGIMGDPTIAEPERYKMTLTSFRGGERLPDYYVSMQWMIDKKILPGGYLVAYDDGYMSYSPPAAFEAGYRRPTTGETS